MTLYTQQDFPASLPQIGRLLALDVGSHTIGLALSDVMRQLASPVDTIRRTKFREDAGILMQLCAQEDVAGLVVGYPLNMDGTEGPRCQSTRAFVRNLEEFIDLPTLLWDERMSSQEAEEAMLATDMSRQKRAKKVDKVAAAMFLQGALEALA